MAASPDRVRIVDVGDSTTSEAGLPDICDRQAKLAASQDCRKPLAGGTGGRCRPSSRRYSGLSCRRYVQDVTTITNVGEKLRRYKGPSRTFETTSRITVASHLVCDVGV
jgi:hypothetical protein